MRFGRKFLICSTANPEGIAGAEEKEKAAKYPSSSVAITRLPEQTCNACLTNLGSRRFGVKQYYPEGLVWFSPVVLLVRGPETAFLDFWTLEEEVTRRILEDVCLPVTLCLYGRRGEQACHVSSHHTLHMWQGAEREHARQLMHLSWISEIEKK